MYTVRMVPNSLLVSANFFKNHRCCCSDKLVLCVSSIKRFNISWKELKKSLPAQNHRHLNILWIALCHTCLSENYILHFCTSQANVWTHLIKYWVRSCGPRYSRCWGTSWTNSPEFPSHSNTITQDWVSNGYLDIFQTLMIKVREWEILLTISCHTRKSIPHRRRGSVQMDLCDPGALFRKK